MKTVVNNLIKMARERAALSTGAFYWRVFVERGPVAAMQAFRIRRLERKVGVMHRLIEEEDQVHEEQLDKLRGQLNDVTKRLHATRASQAHFDLFVARKLMGRQL